MTAKLFELDERSELPTFFGLEFYEHSPFFGVPNINSLLLVFLPHLPNAYVFFRFEEINHINIVEEDGEEDADEEVAKR